MLQKDLDNLNNRCGTNLLGEQVQAKMMYVCSLGCFVFGLIYGLALLANEPGYRKYLMGLWQYEGYCKILLKIGIYLICAGIPAIIFIGIAILFVHNVYVHYILFCIASTAAGLGLSYLAPILTMKCKITKLLLDSAYDY